jgi:hypothetical protein
MQEGFNEDHRYNIGQKILNETADQLHRNYFFLCLFFLKRFLRL